jgi:hypothetical protein
MDTYTPNMATIASPINNGIRVYPIKISFIRRVLVFCTYEYPFIMAYINHDVDAIPIKILTEDIDILRGKNILLTYGLTIENVIIHRKRLYIKIAVTKYRA